MQLPSRSRHGVIDALILRPFLIRIYHLMGSGNFSMFLDRPAKPQMRQVITDYMFSILMGLHVFPQVPHRPFSFFIARFCGSTLRHRRGAQ